MTVAAVGQTWTMIAQATGPRLIEFRIVSVTLRKFVREADCVDQNGRTFSVPTVHLKRGTRGARCTKNPDGSPYVKPKRSSRGG